jgi:hypothetical protein
MSYTTAEIEYKIEIKNIDGNNLHVKVILINLLYIPDIENPFYVEILDLTKEIKTCILALNKYYNEKKHKRSKEDKDLSKIDKLMERF